MDWLRTHRRAIVVGMLAVSVALAAVEFPIANSRQLYWGGQTVLHRGFSDFQSYYVYARVGLRHGWSNLYDAAIQRQEYEAMGGAGTLLWYAMIYPPPMAWVMAPLGLLPYPLASALWTALLLALFIVMWRVAAPGQGPVRWVYLFAGLTIHPVVMALLLEQVLTLVLAAVAVSWKLLTGHRDTLAGLVLLVVLLKPQVAFMVPLALLVAGRRRAFAVFAIGATLIATLAALSLGWEGIRMYADRFPDAWRASPIAPDVVLLDLLGPGPLGMAAEVGIALLVLAVSRRHYRGDVHIPIAAGLVGSLLLTPYLHLPDFATLILAGWIALHARLLPWQRLLPLAGYVLLLVPSLFPLEGQIHRIFSVLLVAFEVVWLGSMSLRAPSAATEQQASITNRPLPLAG